METARRPRAALTADVETGDETTRMALFGQLDRDADAALMAAWAKATADGATVIDIDFGQVDYINSTGIALVVRVLAEARRDGRTVRALGLSEHYRQILHHHTAVGLHDHRGQGDDPAMSDTTIEVETGETTAVLHVRGDVTTASKSVFRDAYTQAVDAGASTIVLDFSGLEYMNSSGIGLLVTLLVRAQRGGQRLSATGLNEHYRQILSLTRLDEAIHIYDTEAAALAAAHWEIPP